MNVFKAACVKLVTELDWNAKCVRRSKRDGKMIRRYARRRIKMNDAKLFYEEADHAE